MKLKKKEKSRKYMTYMAPYSPFSTVLVLSGKIFIFCNRAVCNDLFKKNCAWKLILNLERKN